MNADFTKIDYQTDDFAVTLFVQISQGDRFEVKIEQGQCNFYLNETIVEQIQQAKKAGVSLDIPPKLIIYLWYFICFSNNLLVKSKEENHKNFYIIFILDILNILLNKTAQNQISVPSGITFNSYYKQTKSASDSYEDKDIILQTNVIFNGDIFHKIKYDVLQNSNFSIIVSAHYWLSEQLINAFQSKQNLLLWELASSFTAGFVVYNFNLANWMLSIFTWLGLTILFAISRYVLVNQFQKHTSLNFKLINWLVWWLVSLIPSAIVGGINGFGDVNILLLLPLSSVVAPKLVEYIVSFIQPRVSKLILRRLL